ncbi:hypothetical protein [Stieleria magnilauensis]|uniref:Uncharacterized protein n=1 Tax=Stieleria magnilauensis TaxID=2527963 RepID=A0ABX5Y056_9BACT|nr:hypothetical protein TBK1r_61960 [Planctomycetes bacterium TBK1r]
MLYPLNGPVRKTAISGAKLVLLQCPVCNRDVDRSKLTKAPDGNIACPSCGLTSAKDKWVKAAPASPQPVAPAPTPIPQESKRNAGKLPAFPVRPFFSFGVFLIALGIFLSAYFGLFYDTSVPVSSFDSTTGVTSPKYVNNIGLQQNRLLGFVSGVGCFHAGVTLIAAYGVMASSTAKAAE